VESTAGGASSMSLIRQFLGGKAIGLALVVEADGGGDRCSYMEEAAGG
jgi:hypothetical protein